MGCDNEYLVTNFWAVILYILGVRPLITAHKTLIYHLWLNAIESFVVHFACSLTSHHIPCYTDSVEDANAFSPSPQKLHFVSTFMPKPQSMLWISKWSSTPFNLQFPATERCRQETNRRAKLQTKRRKQPSGKQIESDIEG